MLRAYLTEDKRCYNHPHRIVRTACARCKTPYCDECLTTRSDGLFAAIVAKDEKNPPPLFCPRCVEEVEALEVIEAERHRPLRQRLRPTAAGTKRAAIYVAVITALMVPVIIGVRSMASTTLTPEDFARIKIGLVGSFQTPEGTDFLSSVYGGRYIRASASSQPNHQPTRLIDTWAKADVPGWRSMNATFPIDLVFELPGTLRINKVILLPHPTEPDETWVKDYDVLVSTEGPDKGFTLAASGTLDVARGHAAVEVTNAGDPQRLEFAEIPARWVMLRIRSNQGSAQYTSLAELEVYWNRKQ